MKKNRILSYIFILFLVLGCFYIPKIRSVEAAENSYATLKISSSKYTPTESQDNRRADKGSMVSVIENGNTKFYCILTMMKDKKDINKNVVDINSGTVEFKKFDVDDYDARGKSIDFVSRYAIFQANKFYLNDWYVYKLDKKNFSLMILLPVDAEMIKKAEYDLDNLYKVYNTTADNLYSDEPDQLFKTLRKLIDGPGYNYPTYSYTNEGKKGTSKNPFITSYTKDLSKNVYSNTNGIYADVNLFYKPVIYDKLTINFAVRASFSATIAKIYSQPNCKDEGSASVNLKYLTKANSSKNVDIGRNKNVHKNRIYTNTFKNCEEFSYIDDRCYACGKVFTYQQVPPKSHTWDSGVVTKEPECFTSGEKTYTCTVCKAKKVERIPTRKHEFGEWTITRESTCTKLGLKERKCKFCSQREYVTLEKLPHVSDNVMVVIRPATCETVGLRATHCTKCGQQAARWDIPPKGHTYDSGVIEKNPTTKETGIKKYTCKNCGKIKTETIPKLKSDGNSSSGDKNNSTSDNSNTTNNTSNSTTTEDGYTYADKLSESGIKNNVCVVDKTSGGKYKIIKVTKKNGKVTGGSVVYVAPYNKNCTKMTAPKCIKIAGIKFQVTQISSKAFKGCKNLRSATIEANVHTIGKSAFYGCSKLRTVNIRSKKIRKIGKNAFKGISSKAKVKVPKTKVKTYSKKLKKAGLPKTAKVTN